MSNFAQPVSGGLSFVGSAPKSTKYVLTGALSFVGSVARQTGYLLTGGLSFVGSILTGRLHAGNFPSLTAGLGFTGPAASSIAQMLKNLAGTLGFGGGLTKLTDYRLGAIQSFTGAVSKATSLIPGGGLSLTGIFVGGHFRLKALTGVLSSTGGFSRASRKALTGSLSFVGAMPKSLVQAFTAGLSFSESFVKTRLINLTGATLSFVGSGHRISNIILNAGLSFAGGFKKARSAFLTAGLSFTGSVSRRTSRFVAGVLQPNGVAVRRFGRNLTGSLSFQGTYRKSVQIVITAGLSFTGTMSRAVRRALPGASLSLSGNIVRSTIRPALLSGLSFKGTAQRSFVRSLTGGLSFIGGAVRQLRRLLPGGGLSFTGASSQVQTLFAQPNTGSLSFTTHFEAVAGVDTIYQPNPPTYLGLYPDEILMVMPDFQFQLVPAPSADTEVAPNDPMRMK